MNEITLRDSQKARALDRRVLKFIASVLLKNLLQVDDATIGFEFVGNDRMSEINQQYLHHQGSTDVITFAYSEKNEPVHGDIVICVEEAVRQAKLFKTTWQHELVRYMVHGILHLLGEDDLAPAQWRKMNARENILVRQLARAFELQEIERL